MIITASVSYDTKGDIKMEVFIIAKNPKLVKFEDKDSLKKIKNKFVFSNSNKSITWADILKLDTEILKDCKIKITDVPYYFRGHITTMYSENMSV